MQKVKEGEGTSLKKRSKSALQKRESQASCSGKRMMALGITSEALGSISKAVSLLRKQGEEKDIMAADCIETLSIQIHKVAGHLT